MSFVFQEGQILWDFVMHIVMTAHLSAPQVSGCDTRSKHIQDLEVLSLHLDCARKAQLISEWMDKITTSVQPPNLKARWQAHLSLMLTPHGIPWPSTCQSCPCRKKKLLEYLAPALPLSVLVGIQNTAHTKQSWRELGSKLKTLWERD